MVLQWVIAPGSQLRRPALTHLVVREALPFALAELHEVVERAQRGIGLARLVDRLRGLRAARSSGECQMASGGWSGTGTAGHRDRCREARPHRRGLSSPDLGQRRVASALEAPLGDPGRLAMADERERWSACVTQAGRG